MTATVRCGTIGWLGFHPMVDLAAALAVLRKIAATAKDPRFRDEARKFIERIEAMQRGGR